MELCAFIFDVDGTLADTEQDGHRVAFNTAFADAGLDWVWDPELYLDLLQVTGGKERIRFFCERFQPGFLERDETDDAIRALHARKTTRYAELVDQGRVRLLPGVAELIAEAREAGLRLAIATTTSPDNVTALLTANLGAESLGWFEVIGAGDVVQHKKPAPDVYAYVLRELNLPAEACLAFEDSVPGFASASAAGIPTLVIPSAQAAGEEFPGALAVVPSLADTSLSDLRTLHERPA